MGETIMERIAKEILEETGFSLDKLLGEEHQQRVTALLNKEGKRDKEERQELRTLLRVEEGVVALAKAGLKSGDTVKVTMSPANFYHGTVVKAYSRTSAIITHGEHEGLAPLDWITKV